MLLVLLLTIVHDHMLLVWIAKQIVASVRLVVSGVEATSALVLNGLLFSIKSIGVMPGLTILKVSLWRHLLLLRSSQALNFIIFEEF